VTKNDRACALILLGIAIAASLGASQHELGTFNDPGPGLFPMGLGALLVVLSVIILAGGILAKRDETKRTSRLRTGQVNVSKEALYVIAALMAYGLLLVPLGFILTTFLVFAGLLRLVAEQKWTMVAGGAAVLALASYFIFATTLGVNLPQGILAFLL
jgi:putative tricarboxylic transport membrane protein